LSPANELPQRASHLHIPDGIKFQLLQNRGYFFIYLRFAEVIERALEPKPDNRFRTAVEMKKALEKKKPEKKCLDIATPQIGLAVLISLRKTDGIKEETPTDWLRKLSHTKINFQNPLTGQVEKLIPAKAKTRTAYKAAKTAVRAKFLLFCFISSPPTPGLYERWRNGWR
jgi:hypothetical protein